MQTPLELNFHDVPRSEWSETLIEDRVARLERFSDQIISCTVIVSQPHKHQHKGNPYKVSIEVRLPRNRRLMVAEEPNEVPSAEANLHPVIVSAFSAMEERLKHAGEPRRRDALRPAPDEARGLVVRLFEDQGYGFLRTPDGEERYFHRNAVLHDDFDRLGIGTEVRFEPSTGDAGPAASSLQILNKPGERESDATRARDDVPEEWRSSAD
ncbi:MAG: cold shock domain-containing protein [Gammaproteobacteria bacterium]|jgi:cold shock CspA family protein/ribosome-associated translation inhibitor RaiA|nr:cold shock domain-containing protein [Gammaproteobacteria bacterium]